MASSPATSRSTAAWSGRAPIGRRACWSRSRPRESFRDIIRTASRRRAAGERFHRQGAARRSAGRAGHLLSRALRRTSRRRPIVGEPQVGRFRTAPRDRRSVSFVWSGDTAGQGWGIDEARGGMRTYATMLRNRPDFFIHCGDTIYADCPLGAEQKLPNGEIWRNIVTEEKSQRRRDARRLSRQLQIQSARPQSARLQRRGPDVRAMGRPRGHQRLVARAMPLRDYARRDSTLLLAARGRRAFHEFMPIARDRRRARAHLPQDRLRPAARRVHARHAQLSRAERRRPQASYGPATHVPRAATQVAWLKRELPPRARPGR